MLGLPDAVTACLFDMDGVITQTAKVHDAAWKEMFDDFLRSWSADHGQPFVPFDPVKDYDEYVDGKPRLAGTASFLESRGIELPAGQACGMRLQWHTLWWWPAPLGQPSTMPQYYTMPQPATRGQS